MAGAITVSFSELSDYRQCPLKWHLKWRERWRAPETGPALSKGILWHAVLEAHYKSLKSTQDSDLPEARRLEEANVAAQVAIRDTGQGDDELIDLVLWMYGGYVEKYGVDPQWRILGVEVTKVLPLPNPSGSGKPGRFRLKTKIDLVVRDLSLPARPIRIVDHKSGQNLPSDKELDIDDQFGLYEYQLRKDGIAVFSTVHNAARTTRNKGDYPGAGPGTKRQTLEQRMSRTNMSRSTTELEAIALDAARTAHAAYSASTSKFGLPHSSPNPDTCRWRCDMLQQHLAARKSGTDIREILEGVGFTQHLK